MQKSNPFARATAMMAAITAATALAGSARQQELAAIGPYESRGKGEGRGNRRPSGAHKAAHRAAIKARNAKRH